MQWSKEQLVYLGIALFNTFRFVFYINVNKTYRSKVRLLITPYSLYNFLYYHVRQCKSLNENIFGKGPSANMVTVS